LDIVFNRSNKKARVIKDHKFFFCYPGRVPKPVPPPAGRRGGFRYNWFYVKEGQFIKEVAFRIEKGGIITLCWYTNKKPVKTSTGFFSLE
jgi:hypothetical protein